MAAELDRATAAILDLQARLSLFEAQINGITMEVVQGVQSTAQDAKTVAEATDQALLRLTEVTGNTAARVAAIELKLQEGSGGGGQTRPPKSLMHVKNMVPQVLQKEDYCEEVFPKMEAVL